MAAEPGAWTRRQLPQDHLGVVDLAVLLGLSRRRAQEICAEAGPLVAVKITKLWGTQSRRYSRAFWAIHARDAEQLALRRIYRQFRRARTPIPDALRSAMAAGPKRSAGNYSLRSARLRVVRAGRTTTKRLGPA